MAFYLCKSWVQEWRIDMILNDETKRKQINEHNKDDKEFLEFLKNKGYKVYNTILDTKEEKMQVILQSVIDKLVGPEYLNLNINVKLVFLTNSDINASVIKIGETYYISLFIGTLREVGPFVQNIIMEKLSKELIEEGFGDINFNSLGMYSFFDEENIENKKNRNLANFIANNILLLLVYHELGHIFSGHQEFEHYQEMHMEAVNFEKQDILAQAKEFMADFFSLTNVINIFYRNNTETIERVIQCHALCLCSLYSLYLYFDRGEQGNTYEELFHRSHPHPAVRLTYMMDFADSEVEFQLGQIYQPEWFKGKESEFTQEICAKAMWILSGFITEINCNEANLMEKSFEICNLRIRCLIQNVANDLYEETYRDKALVKLKEIGTVGYDYIKNMIEYEKIRR